MLIIYTQWETFWYQIDLPGNSFLGEIICWQRDKKEFQSSCQECHLIAFLGQMSLGLVWAAGAKCHCVTRLPLKVKHFSYTRRTTGNLANWIVSHYVTRSCLSRKDKVIRFVLKCQRKLQILFWYELEHFLWLLPMVWLLKSKNYLRHLVQLICWMQLSAHCFSEESCVLLFSGIVGWGAWGGGLMSP